MGFIEMASTHPSAEELRMDPKIIELYKDYISGDTSQAPYGETAARLAWQRTVNFFDHYLR